MGVAYLVLGHALGVAYGGYGFPMGIASWIAGLPAGQAFSVHVLWLWQVGMARCVWSLSGRGLLCSLLCSGVASKVPNYAGGMAHYARDCGGRSL